MRLKRVRIFGFKTFADRTEIDFDGDMIAVVGPNGCGKSNLVDAILWGLGEPNARHLRAGSAQDVIFAGSARRKRLGYAEVMLTFDNEDGTLPIDTSEVVVTRRVDRSGESEFEINHRSCRLRDIYDLFADSGLGRAGYAIVGQREIDVALAASPEERRMWVDEAAGVQRYRARRVESFRRLDSANGSLARVQDLIDEIERQLEPLRGEAETARRYLEIQQSLQNVESGLLMQEYAKATQELEAIEIKLREANARARAEFERAEKLEREVVAIGEELGKQDAEAEAVRARSHEAATAFERAQAAVDLAKQRLAGLGDLRTSLESDMDASESRIAELEADAAQAAEELAAAQAERERVAALGDQGESLRKLQEAWQAAEARLQEARAEDAARHRRIAEQTHRQEMREHAQRELQGVLDTLPALRKAVEEAEAAHAALAAKCEALLGQQAECLDQLAGHTATVEAAHADHRNLLAEISVTDARIRGLQATLHTHEGLAQGSTAVLEAVREGHLSGDYVPVAEAIDVDQEYALAIETVLGPAAHDLIVPDEDHARRAIEYLKAGKRGRATFQPVTLVSAKHRPTPRPLPKSPGVLGIAAEFVRSAHSTIVESLLGNVLLVQNLDAALAIQDWKGWRCAVTLDGELVHHSGAVTGGVAARHTAGIVRRRSELKHLQSIREGLGERLERAETERNKAEEAEAAMRSRLQAIQAEIVTAQAELDEARGWLANLRHELAASERSKVSLEERLAQADAVEAMPEPTHDLAAAIQARDEAYQELTQLRLQLQATDHRLAEASEAVVAAERRVRDAQRRLQAARQEVEDRKARMSRIEPDRQRLLQDLAAGERELEAARERRLTTAKELDEAMDLRKQLLERSIATNEEARKAREEAGNWGDLAHQSELARARLETRRANLAQRLLEDYGISPEDAVERGLDIEVPKDAARLVSKLRAEIKAMGAVNVGAVEAFERLNARYAELTSQRDDLNESKEAILKGIAELDALTRDRFLSTFEALQTAFSETFHFIFGGGEAKLSLTHPASPLETGVEVEVTVPGKKRQRLELLSGGERALSACAFLFALLKVKPSPLVILDEVDAPLDSRNVERYLDLLRSFRNQIQFVLITHNEVTIEAAPIWFGITMQEPGVSSVIPYRAPEKTPHDAPAAYLKG